MKYFLIMGLMVGLTIPACTQTPAPTPPPRTPPATTPPAAPGKSSPASTVAGKSSTVINSDMLEFDYQKKVGTFEGNVVAIDPQLTLKCKKMLVYFGEDSNEVLKVEAYGDVHLYQGSKEAIGDKAVFTRETGIVVISGTRPKLKDERGNSVVSMGEGIIYNVHTKLMKVDKGMMEIQSGGDGLLAPGNGK